MSNEITKALHEGFRKLDPRQNILMMEFSREAGEFLEKTERPTHLRVSQFAPYSEIFRPDPKKYRKDLDYMAYLERLTIQYYTHVVNPFYPVFIHSDTTGEIVSAHDRVMNYVNPASITQENLKRRETLEADSKRMSGNASNAMSRSFNDMLQANDTPEFMELVKRWKVESMIISTIQKRVTPADSKVLAELENAPLPTTLPVEEDDGDFL